MNASERMSTIDAEQRELVAAADNGDFKPGDKAKFDELQAEYDELKQSTSIRPRRSQPVQPGHAVLGEQNEPSATRVRGGRRYADLFGPKLGDGDFGSIGEFLSAIHCGLADARLQPAFQAAASGGVPSAGGFLIPEAFASQMLDAALESEIVRPRADVRPMESETLTIAGFQSTDNSSSSLFGGFTANWIAESTSITDEQGTLRRIKLESRKLAVFTKSSNELLADAGGFENQLVSVLTQAVAWHLDDAFLNGTGSGQPKGVLNDAALITITKETGQGASTIVYENVIKAFSRLHPASVNRAVWVCNPGVIPQLLTLTQTVGTGGSAIPVMSDASGRFRMLTLPVLFSEKMPALGSKGDILLADFSQYIIGLRRSFSIERSMHIGFQTDETAWRGILRADGQGKWEKAFTPKNGSTQSWCVTLAART